MVSVTFVSTNLVYEKEIHIAICFLWSARAAWHRNLLWRVIYGVVRYRESATVDS
jgi:uncharacterized membrane protein YhfC